MSSCTLKEEKQPVEPSACRKEQHTHTHTPKHTTVLHSIHKTVKTNTNEYQKQGASNKNRLASVTTGGRARRGWSSVSRQSSTHLIRQPPGETHRWNAVYKRRSCGRRTRRKVNTVTRAIWMSTERLSSPQEGFKNPTVLMWNVVSLQLLQFMQ